MRRTILILAAAGIFFLAGSSAAMAAGPVDGEVAVVYWMADTDDSFDSFDAEGPGLRGDDGWKFGRWRAKVGAYGPPPA